MADDVGGDVTVQPDHFLQAVEVTVIGAQRLDVAYRGVQTHALQPEPLHVGSHAVGGDVGKRQCRTASEPAERADSGTIVFGCAELLLLLAFGGFLLGTAEEAGTRPLAHAPGERQAEMAEATSDVQHYHQ